MSAAPSAETTPAAPKADATPGAAPHGKAPLDFALLAVAIAGVSLSAPLIAATAAPALAIAFWRNAMASGVLSPFALAAAPAANCAGWAAGRFGLSLASGRWCSRCTSGCGCPASP